MQADGGQRGGGDATLRPSQVAALGAIDERWDGGGRAGYVVLPPGSGKTRLGVEAARRAGRRALVLAPNTVVQQQWLQEWRSCAATGDARPVSVGRDLRCDVVVLTFASLSDVDRSADDEPLGDQAAPTAELAEQRRAAVRGEPGSEQLSLLHDSGRALLRSASQVGPWTLLLDEAHHLLTTWGALVPAVATALGSDTLVLGLTASPTSLLPPRAAAVQRELFGPPLVEVVPPRAVRDGEIAPYQELLHLCVPTPDEATRIAADGQPFEALRRALVDQRRGTLPLLDWLYRRLHARDPGWQVFERDEPALARAGLRLVDAGMLPLPAGVRLREQHRAPPDGQDWAALLGAYATAQLQRSTDPEDAALLRAVHEVLPRLGWSLSAAGLRRTTADVERWCAGSQAKQDAALEVLVAEHAALGDALRALVVCDAESAAGLGALPVFAAIAGSQLGATLRPLLCTGRSFAVRRDDLPALRAFSPTSLADRLVDTPLPGTRSLVRVSAGPGWSASAWVPLVRDWLAEGGTQLVVGTRGLLGEGWDCPQLGVVLDLTTTGSPATAWQVRSRALHLHPEAAPVADLWSFACVADGHPHGAADYLRVARLHAAHLAADRDGQVEAGIGHCDEALLPHTAPDQGTRAAANGRALVRPGERELARELWQVGTAYDDALRSVLLVRAERPLGLPGGVVPAAGVRVTTTLAAPSPAPVQPVHRTTRLWPLPVTGGVAAAAAGTAAQGPLLGTGAGLGTGLVVGGAVAALRYGRQRRAVASPAAQAPTGVLDQLAAVVADALQPGDAAGRVQRTSVRGGWTALSLQAPADLSATFAGCLDELLAPLADPRWIVSRLVLALPATTGDRRRLAAARAVGRAVDAAVTWHAVPAALARSRPRLSAFETGWRRHVGPGRLLRTSDGEGAALLELLRGEDPFGLTTRLRTTWH